MAFDPAILDILMQGQYGGGQPEMLSWERLQGMEPLSQRPEDVYDYLMTPRYGREFTQAGPYQHYGPSRYATIPPENRAMAETIMDRMQKERMGEEDQRRMAEARSIMTGRAPGTGGEITLGGRTETIAPKGPLTPEEQVGAMAGGMPVQPLIEAQAKKAQTAAKENQYQENLRKYYIAQAEDYRLKAAKKSEAFENDREKFAELDPYKDENLESLVLKWQAGELPANVAKLLAKHLTEYLELKNLEKSNLDKAEAVDVAGGPGQAVDLVPGPGGTFIPAGQVQ